MHCVSSNLPIVENDASSGEVEDLNRIPPEFQLAHLARESDNPREVSDDRAQQ
jgi:hypothetical protein